MKLLFVLCVLVIVALASANPQLYPRGCIYVDGKCHYECPEGTHLYTVSNNKPWHFEPTCEDPNPADNHLYLPEYSGCYCDSLTVRDSTSGKCVTVDKCPPQGNDGKTGKQGKGGL